MKLDESKFLELHKRQRASGLTVKDFCFNEGIHVSTFYYWQKKLKQKSGTKDFIPLVVKPSAAISTQNPTKGFHSVQNKKEMDADDVLLELVYLNKTTLRIKRDIDLAHLRALVTLID